MCGVIGIHGSQNAALEVYQALLLLQHRGQDAAGILSFDKNTGEFHIHKDQGLVGQVFDEKNIRNLEGESAVGHTRYATLATKKSYGERDLQPIVVNYPKGLGLAHNGNIVNVNELTDLLNSKYHRMMLTKNDAEILLNLMSSILVESMGNTSLDQLKFAASKIFDDAQGGYAIVGLWGSGHMFAIRDPHGIRPLVMGRKELSPNKYAYMFSSESNAISFLGYEVMRDVEPGELIVVDEQGILTSTHTENKKKKAPCMFEWIYFATPESVMDNAPVYQARINLGKKLGNKIKKMIETGEIAPDVVIPVPESGRIASISVSEVTGVPYRELLIKNRYIQRSFILQDQESRKRAVKLKLMAVTSEIKGKKVLLIDDSIVRGTTSKRLIDTVREAGASEVYFVSTCPPIKHPCFFGIDFPLRDELVAGKLSESEVADVLGADKVIYQSLEDLNSALMQEGLCTGCLNGEYPFDVSSAAKIFTQDRLDSIHS